MSTEHEAALRRLVHYQPSKNAECIGAVVLDGNVDQQTVTLAVPSGHYAVWVIETAEHDEERGPRTWHKHHDKESP